VITSSRRLEPDASKIQTHSQASHAIATAGFSQHGTWVPFLGLWISAAFPADPSAMSGFAGEHYQQVELHTVSDPQPQ